MGQLAVQANLVLAIPLAPLLRYISSAGVFKTGDPLYSLLYNLWFWFGFCMNFETFRASVVPHPMLWISTISWETSTVDKLLFSPLAQLKSHILAANP